MNNNNMNCPSIEKLESYLSSNLTDNEMLEVDAHVFECDFCTSKLRELNHVHSMIAIAKARPTLGIAWEKYGDLVDIKAAGENNVSKFCELTTKNGKFKVTFRPFEKKPELALLEIEVCDHTITGQLKVSSTDKHEYILDIDENRTTSSIVSSSIDIERIIIKKHIY